MIYYFKGVKVKIIITFVTLLAFAVPLAPLAKADGGFYIEAKIGASNQKIKRDVVVNSPLQDITGNFELGTGPIPAGSLSHSTVAGGVAFGYNFASSFDVPIRVDLELLARGYRKVDQAVNVNVSAMDLINNAPVNEQITIFEDSSVAVHTIMANIYYDIMTNSAFTPFVGAGLGLSILHVKLNSIAIEDYYREDTDLHAGDVQFAWGLTGGVGYALNDNWSLSMAYKFTDAGSKSFTADRFAVGLESDVQIHDVLLGARYTF